MDSCPGSSRDATDEMLAGLINKLRAHPALRNSVFVLLIEANYDSMNQTTYYTSLSKLPAASPMYLYKGTKSGYGVYTTNKTKNSGAAHAWNCMMEAQVWFATDCVGPIADRTEHGAAGALHVPGLKSRLLKQLRAMRRVQTQTTELSSSSRHTISGKGPSGNRRDDFAMSYLIAAYFSFVLQQQPDFINYCASVGCKPEFKRGGFHGAPADELN